MADRPLSSPDERPIFIPLAGGPFMRFADGVKRVELRKDTKRWGPHNVRPGRPVTLSLGYGKKHRLSGWVGRVVRAPDFRELPAWALDAAGLDPHVRRFEGESQYAPWGVPMVAIEIVFARPFSDLNRSERDLQGGPLDG